MEIHVLSRQGLTIKAIARQLGLSRNTVRRYLRQPPSVPQYPARTPRPTKLDPFQDYLKERVQAAAPHWIPATVLLRELQERGYDGGISQLKAYLQPLKPQANDPVVVAAAWALLSFAMAQARNGQGLLPLVPVGPGFWEILKLSLEAGMVGGLADWYAITVLFRDPFGRMWVPGFIREHTSIIPRKKDKIANELGHFVQANFLAPQHVEESLRQRDLVGSVAELMLDEDKVRVVTKELKHVVLEALSMVDEPEIESMVRQTVVEWLRTLDVHLVAYEMVNAATASDVHKDALQWGLEELASQLDKHGDALAAYIEGRLKEKSGVLRLATNFFDTRGDIVGDVIDSVRKVMKDETHPARQQIEAFVLDYARLLRQEGSAQQRQVLALRDRLVNSPEVVGFVSQTVRNVIDSIMLDLLRSNSRIVASLEQAARDLARRLLLAEQEQVRHLINRKAVDMAVHFSREYAETAVQYISDKVGAWDASTMTEIIEEKVGEDLHAIRINGVIVGGIIGLFIGAAGQLIG